MTPWTRRRYVKQEIVSRYERFGIDRGAEAKVLVRTPTRRLVWRGGYAYWSGIHMGRPWHAARLTVELTPGGNEERWRQFGGFAGGLQFRDQPGGVFEGGRLTLQRLETHIETIQRMLGLPNLTARAIKLDRTCVVPALRTPKKGKTR